MKNELKIALVLALAFMMSSCLNPTEKMEKAKEYYVSNGYDILAAQSDEEIMVIKTTTQGYEGISDNYILVKKNGEYYLDTEFKNKGKSAMKIYPNDSGLNYSTLKVSFKDGIKGLICPVENENNVFFDDILFHDSQNKDGKDVLYTNNYSRCYYYLIGGKDVLVLNSRFKEWKNSGFSNIEFFNFADLYDNSDYQHRPFSLEHYAFTIEEEFSLKDLSFLGFSNMALKKEKFPWRRIKDMIGHGSQIFEDNDYIYIPASWIGTPKMDLIKGCIDDDIEEREAELIREQQRVQEEQRRQQEEQYRANIINNAIYFPDMIDDFKNPIKAEKKYSAGMEIILKVYVDKIRNYSSSGYKYLITDDRLYEKARIYTNDENFAEIDYPCYVWIHARFNDRESYWDEVIYSFTDAQLLLSKKSSW